MRRGGGGERRRRGEEEEGRGGGGEGRRGRGGGGERREVSREGRRSMRGKKEESGGEGELLRALCLGCLGCLFRYAHIRFSVYENTSNIHRISMFSSGLTATWHNLPPEILQTLVFPVLQAPWLPWLA